MLAMLDRLVKRKSSTLIFGLICGVIGTCFSVLIRMELARPGNQILGDIHMVLLSLVLLVLIIIFKFCSFRRKSLRFPRLFLYLLAYFLTIFVAQLFRNFLLSHLAFGSFSFFVLNVSGSDEKSSETLKHILYSPENAPTLDLEEVSSLRAPREEQGSPSLTRPTPQNSLESSGTWTEDSFGINVLLESSEESAPAPSSHSPLTYEESAPAPSSHSPLMDEDRDYFDFMKRLPSLRGSSNISGADELPAPSLSTEPTRPPEIPTAEAGPSNQGPAPYPYRPDHVIGGDSVETISRRLLINHTGDLTSEACDLARMDAEDLFEVKVDIIREMKRLDPEGPWLERGARVLDNPRTSTGEESLERLHSILDELKADGPKSEAFRRLQKKRLFF